MQGSFPEVVTKPSLSIFECPKRLYQKVLVAIGLFESSKLIRSETMLKPSESLFSLYIMGLPLWCTPVANHRN